MGTRVAERAAVNASPLIVLAKARRLELLRLAAARIVVPRAVADEVRAAGPSDPAAAALRTTAWIEIVDAPPPSAAIIAARLGEGESALLAWGEANRDEELILDDYAARRCAEVLALRVRGSLSLVVQAKRLGVIPSARAVIGELRAAGIYLSDRLAEAVLKSVDE